MKLGLALMVAILTLGSPVSADVVDTTGTVLEANQTKVQKFTISSETAFDVRTYHDISEISCEIYASDRLVSQDPHVHHCFGVVKTNVPINVYIEVTNQEQKATVFYIDQK